MAPKSAEKKAVAGSAKGKSAGSKRSKKSVESWKIYIYKVLLPPCCPAALPSLGRAVPCCGHCAQDAWSAHLFQPFLFLNERLPLSGSPAAFARSASLCLGLTFTLGHAGAQASAPRDGNQLKGYLHSQLVHPGPIRKDRRRSSQAGPVH